jgi:hypothetical protein
MTEQGLQLDEAVFGRMASKLGQGRGVREYQS